MTKKIALNFDRLFARDYIRGGKGDMLPDRMFKKKQLAKGVKHEREHTMDPEIAKEIAKDHLAENPDYYTMLERAEKKADASSQPEAPAADMSPNNTMNLTSMRLPPSEIDKILESVQDELGNLMHQQQAQADPSQGEADPAQAPTPEDQQRLEHLQMLERGLKKILNQQRFAIRDEFIPAEVSALADLDLLTRPAASSKHEMPANSFTDDTHGAFAATSGGKSAGEKVETMIGSVDLNELRTTMFFEGVTDELCKRGLYLERPVEFFAGCYDGMRQYFEPSTEKRAAAGTYPEFAVNACRTFLLGQLEMVKAAALGQIQPIKPIQGLGGGQVTIPDPNESASHAIATDPQRMARRQDLIDELLPHAESIQLDPDGGIKLKMPDPVARAMKMQDAQVKQIQQAQQQATQQQLGGAVNAQQVGQQAQQAAGQGTGVMGDAAGTPANGGEAPDQMAALRDMFGAGSAGGTGAGGLS